LSVGIADCAEGGVTMNRRVLVIEDQAGMRAVISRTAERLGFTVGCVADGGQAMNAFTEMQPDIVIVDMILPGMHGADLLRGMLESGIKAHFVLTTGSGIGDAYLSLAEGVARYHGVWPLPVLLKPYRLADLVEVLQQLSQCGSDPT
jgi:CheY-like chemotaxis protein